MGKVRRKEDFLDLHGRLSFSLLWETCRKRGAILRGTAHFNSVSAFVPRGQAGGSFHPPANTRANKVPLEQVSTGLGTLRILVKEWKTEENRERWREICVQDASQPICPQIAVWTVRNRTSGVVETRAFADQSGKPLQRNKDR